MEPIKTALCSFGMSGRVFHAPFIDMHPGFSLYAVMERSKQLASGIYPGIKTFRSLDELLADPLVELVIVNTPNSTHYSYARQAIEAGKHVIVEKPFTVTSEEGAKLIALAARHKVRLSVYHNRRYDSDFRTVAKVVGSGLLGNIIEAEIHYDRFREELSPKVHKETPGPGTGALYDLGSHLIDQALILFGMPAAVFADVAIFRPASQVDDYFELLLFYPAHRVRLKCSYLVREALPGYIFHGTKGSFIKPKTDVQETKLQAGEKPGTPGWGVEPESEKGLLHTEKDGTVIRDYIPSETGNYADYFEGIFQAIRKNEAVPVDPADAVNVIRLIEAALESSREHRVVNISDL